MSRPDGPLSQLGTHEASFFTRLGHAASRWTGRPATFVAALFLIVTWGISGPFFGFSDTWQLVINTSTTIITFLMVFVIQSSQNCDSAAVQIKLDELISKLEGAREELLDLEEMDQEKLEELRTHFEERAKGARLAAQRSAPRKKPGIKPSLA
jgi:low affinity Fe/Cu permease